MLFNVYMSVNIFTNEAVYLKGSFNINENREEKENGLIIRSLFEKDI
jgi:hypothetical protein